MKIGITNDHRGIEKKNKIVKFLKSKGYEVFDFGSNDSGTDDYPIYAFDIAKRIINKEIDFGILLCRTGVGMSIAANKVNGIRCANVNNVSDAKLSRLDNNANAISLNSSLSMIRTKDILDIFLKTKYLGEERHQRRIDLIDSYKEVSNDN